MRCTLYTITAPTVEPLTTAEAKEHVNRESAFTADDTKIGEYVKAAREWFEEIADRSLLTQTLEARFDEFPGQRVERREGPNWDGPDRFALFLPRSPIASITSIKYDDSDGVEQTLSASLYRAVGLAARTDTARIAPAFGQSWPSTRDQAECVRVRYVAGFGATAAVVSPRIRQLMRLLVAHQYANREPIAIGTTANELPMTIRSFLWSARVLTAA